MASVTVDVEIDLNDIETEDLEDELRRRGEEVGSSGASLQGMFVALSFGNEAQALSLLRGYLCDRLGRVLP